MISTANIESIISGQLDNVINIRQKKSHFQLGRTNKRNENQHSFNLVNFEDVTQKLNKELPLNKLDDYDTKVGFHVGYDDREFLSTFQSQIDNPEHSPRFKLNLVI